MSQSGKMLAITFLIHLCCNISSAADSEPITFTDVSRRVSPVGGYGDYAALWADLNSDDLLDLVFVNHVSPLRLLRQDPDHTFSDATGTSGIELVGRDRHGASCGDYDNDGDMDLYVSNGAERGNAIGRKSDELLRNEGNFSFKDVTDFAGADNGKGRGRSGTWIDYNSDGLLDLYVTNYQSTNVMYRNNGGGTFSDVTRETGLDVAKPRAAWADYDQDGDIDVAISWPLQIFKNMGDGVFADTTSETGLQKQYGYTLAWGDADGDGDLDLFIGASQQAGTLMINNSGKFTRHIADHHWGHKESTSGSGATWGDLDSDGDLDLVAVRSDGLRLFENLGNLRFSERAVLLMPSQQVLQGDPALADFDNDGYLDIALESISGNRLFQNNGAGNNWLKLRFEGKQSNRMGKGARVWLYDESELVGYREYLGDNGTLFSIGCGPLHFGLHKLESVDVKIKWPSGQTSLFTKVAANQLLLAREPGVQ